MTHTQMTPKQFKAYINTPEGLQAILSLVDKTSSIIYATQEAHSVYIPTWYDDSDAENMGFKDVKDLEECDNVYNSGEHLNEFFTENGPIEWEQSPQINTFKKPKKGIY